MALQLGTTDRNGELDQLETVPGVSAILKLRTGAQPADCAAADTGAVLVTITVPVDWMNAASGGTKTKLGTWSAAASAAGTALHFRLYDSSGVTCHAQGSVGLGSGDLSLDNNVIAIGQTVTITGWTYTAGNA